MCGKAQLIIAVEREIESSKAAFCTSLAFGCLEPASSCMGMRVARRPAGCYQMTGVCRLCERRRVSPGRQRHTPKSTRWPHESYSGYNSAVVTHAVISESSSRRDAPLREGNSIVAEKNVHISYCFVESINLGWKQTGINPHRFILHDMDTDRLKPIA
jgi:hypothetical protein